MLMHCDGELSWFLGSIIAIGRQLCDMNNAGRCVCAKLRHSTKLLRIERTLSVPGDGCRCPCD